MIILTNPLSVPVSFGSSTTATYDKIRIVQITSDPLGQQIQALVQLLSSTNPNLAVIRGSLIINLTGATPSVVLQCASLGFTFSDNLTAGQVTTIQGWITTMQNNLEAGIISLGAIAGTQSTGV
jgi:hypothetical protein